MGGWASPLAKRTRPLVIKNIILINQYAHVTYTNYVMVMITIHIANITCLVTRDAWHAYGVIGVYKVHHGAGRIS